MTPSFTQPWERRKRTPAKTPIDWYDRAAWGVVIALLLVLMWIVSTLPLPKAKADQVCDDSCICASLDRYDIRGMEKEVAAYCDKYGGL